MKQYGSIPFCIFCILYCNMSVIFVKNISYGNNSLVVITEKNKKLEYIIQVTSGTVILQFNN